MTTSHFHATHARPWWQTVGRDEFAATIRTYDEQQLAVLVNEISAALISCQNNIEAGIADEEKRQKAHRARTHLAVRKKLVKAEISARSISQHSRHRARRRQVSTEALALLEAGNVSEALRIVINYIDPGDL